MENLSLFPSKYLLLCSLPNPSGLSSRRFFALPHPSGKIREGTPKTRNFVSALGHSSYDGSARRLPKKVLKKLGVGSSETSSLCINPQPSVPPPHLPCGNILKGECDYFFNLVARYARVLTKLVLHLKKSFQKLWPTLKLLWRFKSQECKLPSWIVHRILSIAKYQNEKEVMNVFNKIAELLPGATGSP